MNLEQKITRTFHKACQKYQLLEDADRILIGLSGGKDSLELVRLMARQMRIHKPSIHVEAAHVVMHITDGSADSQEPYVTDHAYIEQFCHDEGMPLHILHASFDASTDHRRTKCFLCSWNRRKTLFEFATREGFNKVALGHHMDDILVTMLMNLTFEGSTSSMTPRMTMRNYPLTVIRPLCLVHEEWIRTIATEEGFTHQKRPCPYEQQTQRTELERVFHHLEHLNPEARYSMWHALFPDTEK